MNVGHLSWDADLVAVEVVVLLAAFTFFGYPVAYLRQRFVTVGIGVEIGIPSVPKKSGFFFKAVWNVFVFQMAFAYPSAQGIVAVHPSFFRTIFFKEFRFNQLVMQVVEVVLHFSVG